MKFSKFILLFLIGLFLITGCGQTTTAPATPPVVTSLALADSTDGSTTTTDSLTVNFTLAATGGPTQMMLAETSDFASRQTKTPSWGDFRSAATFTFTGAAGTKTLYCKLKNLAGESPVATQSITYQPVIPPTPPVTEPEWFTWWGGRTALQIASANAVMLDETAPLNEKSAGWIGIYPQPGAQDDPQYITDHLNTRLAQGFQKAFFEVERGFSRNEIQALKTWAGAHPNFKLFIWLVSYNWIHPYGSPPTEGNYASGTCRQYCYWDEFEGAPSNMILCWLVYFSLHGMLESDFSNKQEAAVQERAYLDQHYLPFMEQFNLKNQSLFVLSLGGASSANPLFDLTDLTREMTLCKEKLPLGLGFFGNTDGWHSPGAIEAADNFCLAWLAE